MILSASGDWIGQVMFPRPFMVLDVLDTFVLGVFKDGLDVQGIAVYRYGIE